MDEWVNELFPLMKTAIKQKIDLVNSMARYGQVPMRTVQIPHFETDSTTPAVSEQFPYPQSILRSPTALDWPPQHLHAILRCVELYKDLEKVIFNGHATEHNTSTLTSILNNFLDDYLEEAVPCHPEYWDDTLFAQLYQQFAQSIKDGQYTIYNWMPLYNFQMETNALVRLDNDTLITVPTREDWIELKKIDYYALSSSLWRFERLFMKHTTVHEYYATMDGGIPERANQWLNAVRLVAGGNPKIHEVLMVPKRGEMRITPWTGGTMVSSIFTIPTGGNRTILYNKQIPIVKRYVEALQNVATEFPILMTRWIIANQRRSAEDRVIDAAIALESLLLPNDSQELSFRLSLRGAWLLGSSPEERKQLLEDFKMVYRTRSKIVHGDAPEHVPDTADVADRLLRKLIEYLVIGGYKRANWKSHLDKVILG